MTAGAKLVMLLVALAAFSLATFSAQHGLEHLLAPILRALGQ